MAALAEAFVRVRPNVDVQEFRRQTEKAMRESGGSIKVTLDSSQVGRDLTVLRAEIGKLAGKDLTIGVDVTKAYIDVVTLREEIQQLGRLRPTVRADADTARAMAQVAALTEEVRRLDGLNPTIRPDVDDSGVRSVGDAAQSSSSGISALVAAGVALAPAIVPSAAAVAQAIAGITQMAIGAAGGIGVIALASVGVVSALKAMSAADDQATQSTVSLAGNQVRLAAASDAVGSAQASLANTVANAADSQRRASQSIVTAELSETDAHRTLAQAQQAVTQARIDAARAAEDLSSRVAHNAIDQQQATLDVTKAEEALAAARANAAGANTPTNNRAVQEAQIALEQQKLRVQDLSTEHQRLAVDKAKSDKQGIDGSSQVVSAFDRVRQAAEQVHKAEQATADARISYTTQARQSAASIAQAQQSVINAQRSLQQATEQTATAGGSAMLALQQSMANLSPEGRRFTEFLYGLKPVVLDLRRTAEGGLLPGAQAGIQALLPLLPEVTGYVSRYATAVGNLAQRAGEAFAQPYWRGFARDLVGSSIPAMETAAGVAYNMALGVSALVRASLPLGQEFGGGLLRFSESFAHWALTVQNTQGFRDLMDYVRTQGPVVAQTIGDVVRAAVRLVEAIAPIGGVSLTIIRLLADTINALPVPVLTGLAGGIGLVVLGTKAWALANGLLFSSLGVLFVQMIVNAQTAMALAATEGAGRLAASLAGVRAAAGTLASTIGPAGALGIALAGAAILAGIYVQKSAEQKTRVDSLTRALGALGDAYKKTHDLGSQSVQDVVKQNDQLSKLVANSKAYGVSVEQIARATSGDRNAQQSVIATLEARQAALKKLSDEEAIQDGKDGKIFSARAGRTAAQIGPIKDLENALKGQFGQLNQNDAAQRALTDAQRVATESAYKQGPAESALGDALRKLADSTSTAADKAGALRAADEAVFGAARAAIRAQEDQAASEDAVAAAGKRNADQHIVGAATLDLHTEAGRNNRRILEDRMLALGQEYLADVQAGVGVDAATTKHDTNRDALVNAAKAAGFDTTEVGKLVTTFGTLPTDPKVQVTVSGVQAALTQLENLEIAQLALKQGLDPSEATRQYKKQRAQANNFLGQGGLATGGPVFGPGGPTEDKIPVWLSNGEHVITAREVQAAGGHGAIEAIRKTILGGRSPQARYPGDGSGGLAFANGGAVQWPFQVDASKTKIPSLDEIRRVALFGPDYTGPMSGGMEAAAAFVRAQVGKPYVWASAGPFGYDCSGIVSAAWNVAHGHDPYNHTFSTMNEAGYFPLPGYGPFTAAWTNPGERGPGGDSVGHTAARIGNFAFESIGGQGVRVGSSVTPLGSFAHIGHYADGGPVTGLPVRSFDTGGWLPPNSATVAVNGTSQWEPVGPPGGGGNVNHFHINGYQHSKEELVAEVIRELAWQLR